MRLSKNIKILFNYFLGPVLAGWLVFSLYNQLRLQPHLEASWQYIRTNFWSSGIIFLPLMLSLMPLNWGLEALKWRLAVNVVHPAGFWQSLRAVLAGVSFSAALPSRLGDYLGRILYLPEEKRLKVISLSLISGLSQLVVTMVVGVLGLWALQGDLVQSGIMEPKAFQACAAGLTVCTLLLLVFYFRLDRMEGLLARFFRPPSYLFLVEAVRNFGMQRLGSLLLLSLGRYAVFVSQYILAFHLFGVDVSLLNGVWVMGLVFLALSVVPSVIWVEIGARGAVSLWLLGLFSANSLGILLATASIWAINLLVPALVGSLLILRVKVFKRR